MKAIVIMCLVATVSSCGAGSGVGEMNQQADINGEPLAGLEKIQNEIFLPICAECHNGPGAPQGLQLNSLENSFNFLVGVESSEIPERLRVFPGDPDSSYLVQKIEGESGIVGSQMPLGGSALSNQQISLIRNWITDGAEQLNTQKPDQPVQNKSTELVPTTTIEMVGINRTDKFLEIDLFFSRAINADSLSVSSPLVFRGDEDSRTLVPLDDYRVILSDRQLTIHYTGNHQSAMQLSLILNYSGLAELRDSNGLRIDGNDNGSEGGEFHYVYTY